MNAASISEVLSAWEAAARSVGQTLPVGIVERGLTLLPDLSAWAISEDANALFALTKDDVVFSLGISPDSETSLRSRPLYSDRLVVRLSWSEPEPTDAGGLSWNTTWMFYYREERGHDGWQRLSGSVVREATGTERVDARERFCQGDRDASRVGAARLSRQARIHRFPRFIGAGEIAPLGSTVRLGRPRARERLAAALILRRLEGVGWPAAVLWTMLGLPPQEPARILIASVRLLLVPGETAATDRATAYLQTSDGRTLAYEQQGDPGGVPVLVLHGTPGCRLNGLHPDPEKVKGAGLRLITYDRPGYGGSTRQHGRSVVDCVADIAAIADDLGLERFAVTGGSGGAPHALATAAQLPERVTRAECNVGPAPYGTESLDYFNGMDPENVKELGWALAGEETLVPELEREAQKALDRLNADPATVFSEFNLSEADRAVLAQEVVKQRMRISFREAMAQGVGGWVDDDLALLRPWGFDLAEIRVPVRVRYGVTDVLVPAAHGAWLAAHLPGATVLVDEDSGHMSTPDERLNRIREFVGG